MAPEVLESVDNAVEGSDVWSLGAIGFHLFMGIAPFGIAGEVARERIKEARFSQVVDLRHEHAQFVDILREGIDICCQCMSVSIDRRPSAAQIERVCEQMSYAVPRRELGMVLHFGAPRSTLLTVGGEQVFFNGKYNVFGREPKVGDRVMFARYPGHPDDRAFPVVKYGDSETAF